MDLSLTPQLLTAALGIASVLLFWLSARIGTPLFAVAARWMRWAFVAMLGGIGLLISGWTPYPLEVLIALSFLIWFLLETGYLWLALAALNRHHMPLFPKFEENEKRDEWPSQPRFIALRTWLRQTGLELEQAMVAHLDVGTTVRTFAYTDKDRSTRFNVMFLPNARGNLVAAYSVDSQLKDGTRIVTDNMFLPFGGFYPESWQLERHPWMRDPRRIWNRHLERLDAAAQPVVKFDLSPIAQYKSDQRRLEQVNRELGFLNQTTDEEEEGQISPAGRARIWQELWMLAYLGKSFRY